MSPYLVPPTIPERMTMAEYRRLSPSKRRQASMQATAKDKGNR